MVVMRALLYGMLCGSLVAFTTYAGVIGDLPNLSQRQVASSLPGEGYAYCGPTAAANVLLWLGEHGYPNLVPTGTEGKRASAVVRDLGRRMSTDAQDGTRPADVVGGLRNYLTSRGLSRFRIGYEGYEQLDPPLSTASRLVRLGSLRDVVKGKRFALVNVGWYDYDRVRDTYIRKGGHWLTLAGVAQQDNRLVAFLHDPATATRPYVTFKRLGSGRIVGDSHRRSGPAAGQYRLKGSLSPDGVSADLALLDGVVYLDMDSPVHQTASANPRRMAAAIP